MQLSVTSDLSEKYGNRKNGFPFVSHCDKCDSNVRHCEVESSARPSGADQELRRKAHRSVCDVTAEEHEEVVGCTE